MGGETGVSPVDLWSLDEALRWIHGIGWQPVSLIGGLEQVQITMRRSLGEPGVATRTVLTDEGPVDASVYIRGGLDIGAEIVGPEIIEEQEATIWIGAQERAEVHRTGALEITW